VRLDCDDRSVTAKSSRTRLLAPIVACAIAIAAAVVGGACTFGTAPTPSQLLTGNYVLTGPGATPLPGTIVDSAGRRLRVIADTLAINVGDQTYEQRATVAITPAGGTEQPAAPFVVSRRRYTMSGSQTVVFPSTLYGGMIAGTLATSVSLQLRLPGAGFWRYDYR
jgi:hypothetical protein